ncbi:MAG: hypothetical protein IT160_18750 [Bryobacterales bacterium]|nr:hypothetical protein [Bryobacterales bacterium]
MLRIVLAAALVASGAAASTLDLHRATVVVRSGDIPIAEKTAATVLVQEVEKRTGIRLAVSTAQPATGPAILIRSGSTPDIKPEGYRLVTDGPLVRLVGADGRGALYAVGRLLRSLDYGKGTLTLETPVDIATAPVYPIRGHQLGYRTQANSYDAFTIAQFEQYIRELTFFGLNSVEGIPLEDDRPTPVMKVPRREMNRAISEICYRYGLDYWAWIPAVIDLNDQQKRTQLLADIRTFLVDSKEFTGFFVPGGDPGSNPPELVLPFLADVARVMKPIHPRAKVWLSLQWFKPKQVDEIYAWIDRERPAWLGGLVAGPSSPPVPVTRRRLPRQYQLRLYPDITHNKICQYQVPSWDQAYALTLGREAINPRPSEYTFIHNWFAPYSDGFISYSDGVHDDVNKTIWSALAWDPSEQPRDILIDYARVYFRSDLGEDGATAIQALEKNWRGSLADNGAVEATLLYWQNLERRAPELKSNWRWQMCLLRANYDAYVRRRLLQDSSLEQQANRILLESEKIGPDKAMDRALEVLRTPAVSQDLRARIIALCEDLYQSIGLQTSVAKYHASGEERGAVLDFIDLPLNNRWWLEDEFQKVRALPASAEKNRRLRQIATWETPGPGSYYDDIGNIAKSPHVVRHALDVIDPGSESEPDPTFWWWDEGKSRARLSWQTTMWPHSVIYEALDPAATYVVRSTGYGQALLRINGERVLPTADGREMGDIKEFPVPPRFLKDGRLTLTWDIPTDEGRLNWRKHSRLAEVWLIKK